VLSGRAVVDQEASEDRQPEEEVHHVGQHVTIGRISAGNSTFLIRLPPAIRLLADSSSDEENQVHGRMPQNRNSAYGSSAGRVPGSTTVKTNE
jgi:hypothetical protein